MKEIINWKDAFFKEDKQDEDKQDVKEDEKMGRLLFLNDNNVGVNGDYFLVSNGRFVADAPEALKDFKWIERGYTLEDWDRVIEMRSGSEDWKLFLCIDDNGSFTFAKQEIKK